jgi:transcriptional regulator of acetoin/glycerol metabolism
MSPRTSKGSSSKAMARFDGNVSQAAKALGLSRSALYRRLQRYGL